MNYRNTLYLTAISAFLAFSHVCGMEGDKYWLTPNITYVSPKTSSLAITPKTHEPKSAVKIVEKKDIDNLRINKDHLLEHLKDLDKQYTTNEFGRKHFKKDNPILLSFINNIIKDINKDIDILINIIQTKDSSSNFSDRIKFLESLKNSLNDTPKPLSTDSVNELLNIYSTTDANLIKIASELEGHRQEQERLEKQEQKNRDAILYITQSVTGMSEIAEQQLKDSTQEITNKLINDIQQSKFSQSTIEERIQKIDAILPPNDRFLEPYRKQVMDVIKKIIQEKEDVEQREQAEQAQPEQLRLKQELLSHKVTQQIVENIQQYTAIKILDKVKSIKDLVTDKDYNTILHNIWGAIGIYEVTGGIQSFDYLLSILANDKLTNWLGIDNQKAYNYALEHLLSLPLDNLNKNNLSECIKNIQHIISKLESNTINPNTTDYNKKYYCEKLKEKEAIIINTITEEEEKLEKKEDESFITTGYFTLFDEKGNKIEKQGSPLPGISDKAVELLRKKQEELEKSRERNGTQVKVEEPTTPNEQFIDQLKKTPKYQALQKRIAQANKKQPEPSQWSWTDIFTLPFKAIAWPVKKFGSILSWLFPWLK